MTNSSVAYQELDQWIEDHFDQQVSFLQSLVQIPTDTPPGNNAPHAHKTAALLANMGLKAEQYKAINSVLYVKNWTGVLDE